MKNAIGSKNTYTYNAQGLLAQSKNARNQSTTYTYDALERITSTTDALGTISYTYDADGNMTYGPLNGVMTHFTYDCRNRLVSAGNTTYEYDAENNRIAVTVDGVKTEYVIENNASQYSQILSATTNSETTLYIYGDGLLSQVDKDANYLYYHFNNIGSTTVATNDSGKIVRAFTYGTYSNFR